MQNQANNTLAAPPPQPVETNQYDNRWNTHFDTKIGTWWTTKKNECYDEFQRRFHSSWQTWMNLYTNSIPFQEKIASGIDRQFNYTKFDTFFSVYSKTSVFETMLDNSFYRFLSRDKTITEILEKQRKYMASMADSAIQSAGARFDQWAKNMCRTVDDMMQNETARVRKSTIEEIDKCLKDHSAMTRFENRITCLENENVNLKYWSSVRFYFEMFIFAILTTLGCFVVKNNRLRVQ